jgi:hypothetical protein
MADPLSLTSAQFSEALTRESLQITRVIQAAIMTGPLIFLLVIVAFSFQQSSEIRPAGSDFELMNVLSMVHGVLALLALMLSQFLSGAMFSLNRLQQRPEGLTTEMLAARCIASQRAAIIARLAVMEGVSLFGLAVCFVGVMNHVVQTEPSYWFNAASAVIFIMYAAAVFPTRENLVEWFERVFSQNSSQ